MRRVVIGTAGHIDHGKTRLIEALTGIDCDRWAEEKARGITIDLGLAHLEDSDAERGDLQVGFVDVPGGADDDASHAAQPPVSTARAIWLIVLPSAAPPKRAIIAFITWPMPCMPERPSAATSSSTARRISSSPTCSGR